MRESGFRRRSIQGQSELVRAVAHIGPPGLKRTSIQSICSLSSASAGVARPRVDEGKSAFGKRAIEQTPTVAARSVIQLI
jgi:hypothetical protein